MERHINYSSGQTFWLVLMRVLIGWHFLYEGLVKILNPSWSAYPYLMDSKGIFADMFYSIADHPDLLSVSNFINVYGLTLIGLGLILGCLSRYASIGGIFLLFMYYLSHPPYIGTDYMMPTEGSYLWIDKNVVEMAALMVLIYFPTSQIIGLDRFLIKNPKLKKALV